jgi:hypothetical protein
MDGIIPPIPESTNSLFLVIRDIETVALMASHEEETGLI